jgi:hypothetical protein
MLAKLNATTSATQRHVAYFSFHWRENSSGPHLKLVGLFNPSVAKPKEPGRDKSYPSSLFAFVLPPTYSFRSQYLKKVINEQAVCLQIAFQ